MLRNTHRASAPTRKPTIKDVALKAGVSIATVSFVLNKRPGQVISKQVSHRVLEAAVELNYQPNASAAGLARKRTNNLTIVFYKNDRLPANPFYSSVVHGVVRAAMDAEFNVLFSYVSDTYRGPADLPKVVREANTSGAIFIQHLHPRMVEDIQRLGIPVVGIDHFPTLDTIDSLQIDNRRGALLATQHLLDLGHRRIVFLRASRQRPSIAERAAGFRDALRERGLQPSALIIDAKEFRFESAHERALEILKGQNRPTAIFCVNDDAAAGVLKAAWQLGVHVPRELSVVGFDDIAMSRRLLPPLTTVGVDKERLGSKALERLLELVAGKGGEIRQETVPVRLVVRESTGPVGR